MKKLIAIAFLSTLSCAFASSCPSVRAFSCTGLTSQGESVIYYVGFEEMMKVLGGQKGKTYDDTQGFGPHTNCRIPTGKGSAVIRLDARDDFTTGAVNAKIKTKRGTTKVFCEEISGGFGSL